MQDFLTNILTHFDTLPDWLQAMIILLTSIVTTATAVTAATPTALDDEKLPLITKPINFVLNILNKLAGNLGKNINADDPEAPILKAKDITEVIIEE